MNKIYRLVYYSRNLASLDGESLSTQIENILSKSRANNSRDGITGALMFNAGCFAQVLEGPLDAVEAAFERIQQDERHGEVSLLAFEPIVERSFPNWAMGFVGVSARGTAQFANIGASSGFDLTRFNGNELHAILRDLAYEEETAAA